MNYCVRSHGFFFAKETKNPKKNFSRATTLAQRALVKCNFFESFPKETQKQRILRIRIQINPLNPRRERIHWIHNPFLDFTKETKKSLFGFRIRIRFFPKKCTLTFFLIQRFDIKRKNSLKTNFSNFPSPVSFLVVCPLKEDFVACF